MTENIVRICRATFRQRPRVARAATASAGQPYVWKYLPTPVSCSCGEVSLHTDLIHSPDDPDRQSYIACPMCGEIVDPDYEDPQEVARELGIA